MSATTVEIAEYAPEHQPIFEALNREWIEKYFKMEPPDYDMLQHPDEFILKRFSSDTYEFSKLAVDERFRGRKIGLALTEKAIDAARHSGATKIVLYSNTRLVPALNLYRKLGFREVPVDGPYQRSDIKMELLLT